MGGLSVTAAREQSFGLAIASTVAQAIGRPSGEVTLISLTAVTITIASLSVHLHSGAAGHAGGEGAVQYHSFRSLGDSKNVSVVFSIGVLGGVSESMITKLNDAVTNGDFEASLSRNSGFNLTLSGFFTLVYIVAENLRKIRKYCDFTRASFSYLMPLPYSFSFTLFLHLSVTYIFSFFPLFNSLSHRFISLLNTMSLTPYPP